MIGYVLGAPGSGKSAVAPGLRERLPGWVVLDWDGLMGPAGELAGAPIPDTPHTWSPYGRLIRQVVDLIRPTPVLLLGVCTPQELSDWPPGPWFLLDCSDAERRARLETRNDPAQTTEALTDAAAYRALGLPTIDTTGRPLDDIADQLAARLAAG